MSRKNKIIPLLIIIVIFGYLFANVYRSWNQITNFSWNFSAEKLILIFITTLSIYFINAFSWHLITKALGCQIRFSDNLRVWMYSNLSRFIPGGFWQYPGRVYLLNQLGINNTTAASAVLIEALFNLSVGFAVVMFSIIFLDTPLPLVKLNYFFLSVVSLIAILIFIFRKKIMRKFLRAYSKITKKEVVIKFPKLSWVWLPVISLVFLAQYAFAGISLFLLTTIVLQMPLYQIPTFVGIYTASWLLGYLTIFAPGGLGVQDISIAGLLSTLIPISLASSIAILFRILLYVAEIITLIGLLLRSKLR